MAEKKSDAPPPVTAIPVPVGRPAFLPEHTNETRPTVFLKPSEPLRTPVHLDLKGQSAVKKSSTDTTTTDTRG